MTQRFFFGYDDAARLAFFLFGERAAAPVPCALCCCTSFFLGSVIVCPGWTKL